MCNGQNIHYCGVRRSMRSVTTLVLNVTRRYQPGEVHITRSVAVAGCYAGVVLSPTTALPHAKLRRWGSLVFLDL